MKKGISQEGLKLIACVTMLIDHIGYEIIYPLYTGASALGDLENAQMLYRIYLLYRIIGRMAFPIYAFLLVEGSCHTRNKKGYGIRLAVGALLAEIPYDLMILGVISGSIAIRQQSVMLTLLLGFLAVILMDRFRNLAWKAAVMVSFAAVAEILRADYGWSGIVLMGLFAFSREMYGKNWIRFGGMVVLFHYVPSQILWFGNISVPMQVLGALSMLFIANYDGSKKSYSKVLQWGFYLFYPVHMLLLWGLGSLIL